MKMVSPRGLLAAALMASAAPAAATNGMRMIGFGPVQDSMGGASVGAPLDSATIVTNPAGMSDLGTRLDASVTYFNPTVKFSATDYMAGPTNPNSVSGTSDRAASWIPTLGFIYSLNDKLAVGLGVVGVSGMGVDYGVGAYGAKTLTSYMNLRVAPAVSYKISDQVSLGVAANLMYATMEYEAGGMPLHDSKGSMGYGATIGLTYKPTKELTAGLAYETKSFFGDFEWDVAAHDTMMGPVPGGTDQLSFDQPQVLTLGASYRVIEPLLVAADVEWINWSDTNGEGMPEFQNDPNLTGSQRWNMNWSDQVVVKVGAQFDVTKELKVRAGYNYGKMPLDEDRAFENVAFPAVAEHHVTLGAGYDIGKLTVNVAGVWSPEAKISGANMSQGLGAYETKMSQVAVDLGVGYKF